VAAIKNILVTGANGQLGSEIRVLALSFPQYHFFFASREELSVADEASVKQYFAANNIDCCINCAAYTAVDNAEKEREAAFAANALAPGYLAAACKEHNALFIHFSTDYVFAGDSDVPYNEEDATAPLNYYGETKLEGEKQALQHNDRSIVIRTSWVYSSFGKNFVKTMIRLMTEKESIGVVNDQIGSPTYAGDLAAVTMQIISEGKRTPGIYHYSNEGVISWHDFALEIKALIGSNCIVNGIPTSAYPTPAKRSAYSAMDTSKIKSTFGIAIPFWKDSLKKCVVLLTNENNECQANL
jgi:dTDP-4-dehydrorhamnose reductase